jgi:hypothetical protein
LLTTPSITLASFSSLLIIDSPPKAIGNRASDLALGRWICSRLVTLAETYDDKI